MNRINKTTSGVCPDCGCMVQQIIDSEYPAFNEEKNCVEKHFVCDTCEAEWYETFELSYSGCEVWELSEDNGFYNLLTFDKNGNKIEKA